MLIHKTVMSFVTHMECEHDNMICFKLAKDAVGSDRDLLIISVYVPPYLSSYYRQADTNCHIHCLEEFLLSLYERGESSHCLIIGDLNARIGHWTNAEDDSDFNDNGEVKSRNSRDNYINQFGKILIDFCTTFQCLPLNGNTAGDPDGQYTFVSEQGNSVIDYALVSLDFMSKASLFLEIGCRSESSHIPLHLSIPYNPDHCTTQCKTSKKEHWTVFRWDPGKADLFSEAVSSNIFKEKLTEASNLLNESVESATNLFTDNLLQAADVMKRTFFGLTTARTVLRTNGLIVNARNPSTLT